MATAVLHSAPASPHVGRIEFASTRRSRNGWAGTATIEFDGELWPIDLDMIGPYVSEMVRFFDDIARPGWTGAATWRSEFAELTVEAQSKADQLVMLTFCVWWKDGDELDNERGGQLLVRAAALPEFVGRLRELTGRTDQ